MRIRIVGRACAVATFLTAVGCGTGGGPGQPPGPGGETGPGGEPGPGGGPGPETTPVSSCTVTGRTALGGDDTSPAIAFGGGRFAVVWSDRAPGGGDIVLTLADQDGRALHEARVAAGRGSAPAVAALPDGGFLVAWQEASGAGSTVRAVRVDADGKPAAPLTVAATNVGEAHVDVTATRKGALVAWTEASRAAVGAVERGAVTGRLAIPGAAQLALATGPSEIGAVWAAGAQLGFARLPPALGTAAPGAAARAVSFRSATGAANVPRVAAGPDGGYTVVWEDNRGGTDHEAIFLAAVDADGTPSAERAVSPAGGSADFPDVVMIGGRAAVTYYQWREHPPAIYLSLMDPAGGRVGEDLVVSEHGAARFPRLASAGGGKLGVAYAERGGPVRLALVTCQ